jgi:hypothetical protein
MEGISIGYDGKWYLGINLEVRQWEDVSGWCYYTEDPYMIDHGMRLLEEETLLSGKCLIKW